MIDNGDVFEALANGQRRQLLIGLLDDDPRHVSELSEVAREIADADEGLLRQHLSDSGELDGTDEALVRLYHDHLPELEEYGFVEWDQDARLVTKGPRFDDVRPVLELLYEYQDESQSSEAVVIFSR